MHGFWETLRKAEIQTALGELRAVDFNLNYEEAEYMAQHAMTYFQPENWVYLFNKWYPKYAFFFKNNKIEVYL